MRRLIGIFAALAALVAIALTSGCGDKNKQICGVDDFIIINQTELEIVVEQRFGDWPETATLTENTIEAGEEEQILHREWCRDQNVALSLAREVMFAEMKIDGELVSSSIWWHDYWDITRTAGNRRTYTLTVTPELLEEVKDDFDPEQY
ncbi:MAG: hypothetical protein LBV38_06285 [Alistipes sp.]|jgi:hypothetical protein|nr:hypothetical protein [Alistipes sp.]